MTTATGSHVGAHGENMPSVPFTLRRANLADSEFAYEVVCKTIRPYVEQTFGTWQEAHVRATLASNIGAGVTRIITAGAEPVGILTVQESESHVQLDQLFVLPQHQRNGIGTELVRDTLQRAKQLGVPVRLRVLRVNPAKRLYDRLGFFVTSEEPQRFYMQSAP
jgi:ribosomal protein S18 acetylase RimI-like enzyme